YIPLGGNRLGFRRQMANLLLTMGLGGLWHGASWTFILWGLAHGAGIAWNHAMRRAPLLAPLTRIPRWLAVLLTFHFVIALWIVFRSPDLATAARVALGAVAAPSGDLGHFARRNVFPLCLLAVFFALHRWDSHQAVEAVRRALPRAALIPALVGLWVLAVAVSHGSSAKFIYFDF